MAPQSSCWKTVSVVIAGDEVSNAASDVHESVPSLSWTAYVVTPSAAPVTRTRPPPATGALCQRTWPVRVVCQLLTPSSTSRFSSYRVTRSGGYGSTKATLLLGTLEDRFP